MKTILPCPSPRRPAFVFVAVFAFAAIAAFAAPTRTPELTEGPFYTFNRNNTLPPPSTENRDNDLTHVAAGTGTPHGTLCLLSGVVRDLSGAPVKGATVELWQTDGNGVYY